MDLTTEPWLPVRLDSQQKKKVPLAAILDETICDVAWPRADFQGAAWQLLIGILQCTVAPEDEEDWREVWNNGIAADDWQKALNSIAPALQFAADKPAFLQSYEPLASENTSIAGLLIEAPGGNTLKLNKDHFVKRGIGQHLCPHCAAMALFSMQTNSPAGGAGYRVGLRGGGPLTTLVVPLDDRLPLWKKLWLNVLPQRTRPQPQDYPLIFPWLAASKTSEKASNVVTPENAHPQQAYWGMPRRIELDFTHTLAGACDLCGDRHPTLLREMRVKNYGVQYEGWLHPLSPYHQMAKDSVSPWMAMKGQPGGLSYKDWLGLILNSEDKFNRTQPALAVRAAAGRLHGLPAVGLWCFAWDMDKAKARCWYQHRIPLLHTSEPAHLVALLSQVVSLATLGLSLLKAGLKAAWFDRPGDAKAESLMPDTAFWQETEPMFRRLLARLVEDPARAAPPTRQALRDWERALHHYLIAAFDRHVFTDPDSDNHTLLRQLKARRKLEQDYYHHKLREVLLTLAREPEGQHVEQ